VLPLPPADHRHSDERALLAALRAGDALALAEAYHRTVTGAHACACRLLSDSRDVEALLTQVYLELWTQGPDLDESPEGWVRRRCFAIATAHLQQEGRPPASPSTASLLPDLPTPEVRTLAPGERALRELPERNRMALLRAHDAGIPSSQQGAWAPIEEIVEDGSHGPAQALTAALRQLAGPEAVPALTAGKAEAGDGRGGCDDEHRLADWVLGLLDVDEAAAVTAVIERRQECAAAVQTLRRGRRRLEGQLPTPDMGQRIIATALSHGGRAPGPDAPSATEDLTVLKTALADLDDEELDQDGPHHESSAEGHGAEAALLDRRADDRPEPEPEPEPEPAPAKAMTDMSAQRRVRRTILGLLLLVIGGAIGLYVGQAIVAAL